MRTDVIVEQSEYLVSDVFNRRIDLPFTITYYGVSSFTIDLESGKRVAIDPYETAAKLERLPDIVLVTHGASDHLGDAIKLLRANETSSLLAPPDVVEVARASGICSRRVLVMVPGARREVESVFVRATYACHISFTKTPAGYLTGVPLGYIVHAGESHSIYHMGDTSIFGDIRLIAELYRPRTLLVPIGMFPGAVTEMDPEEAALAVSWVRPSYAVPMHYDPDTQAHYTDVFEAKLAELAPEVEVLALSPGESYSID